MATDVPTPQKRHLNPDQQSAFNDALRTGIEQENGKIIELALKNGADPNILMFAGISQSHNHGLDWVQLAVQFGAGVNATNPARKDDKGGRPYPAIHCAYENFSKEITDFLIAKGASVDTPSPANNTPLMRAVANHLPALVRYYIEKGADPMRVCAENNFPLRELQRNGAFSKDEKSELLVLMMTHIPPTPSAFQPTNDFNAASDEGLPNDIKVNKPLSLKHRGFTL